MIEHFKDCMKKITNGELDCDELGVTEEVIEACLSRICFVESKEVTMRARDVQYELPIESGKICVNIPGKARCEPCEALFGKNEFEINIAEFICETLMKAPVDLRCRLCANILVVGGVAHIPGLEKRLGQELRSCAELTDDLKKPLSLLAFQNTPFHHNSNVWIGACIAVGLKPSQEPTFIKRNPKNDDSK